MSNIPEEDMFALQCQLADLQENLRLIQKRKAEFVFGTEIPLQLVKEECHLVERIAELKQKLADHPVIMKSAPEQSLNTYEAGRPGCTLEIILKITSLFALFTVAGLIILLTRMSTDPVQVAIHAIQTAQAAAMQMTPTRPSAISQATWTPTPSSTPVPTGTPAPILPTNTPTPTPRPTFQTRTLSDFDAGIQGWLAESPGDQQTARSVRPSAEAGHEPGALWGDFDFSASSDRYPRATYEFLFPDKPEDWRNFTELHFDAQFLPTTSSDSIKATIVVRTKTASNDSCFNESGNFQLVKQNGWSTLVFKLHENNYKNCEQQDDYTHPLLSDDQVVGLAIVFIPNPDSARFTGAILIDNVRLVAP